MSTQLIITADDFGANSGVNKAVLRAHRDGILTSASLMVTGQAADEAVLIARDNPSLAIGLHLALSNAKSILPHAQIPDLVDVNRRFLTSDIAAGFRYCFNSKAKMQLKMEIKAQFQAFAEYGIPLSHVDGHQHLHVHPILFPIVIEQAIRYGAMGIRIPHEPFLKSVRAGSARLGYMLTLALSHAYLRCICRRLLPLPSRERVGVRGCNTVIGSMMSGMMTDDYVIKMLGSIESPTVEVFFHPSEACSDDPFGPNPGDLEALLSPKLRDFIITNDFKLTTYAGMNSREEANGRI